MKTNLIHIRMSRRTAVQAGAVGLLGLGSNHLQALRCEAGSAAPAKACIFIFLSGGLSQHDSFDMKPHAPDDVRGEFEPISTRTPGLQICEHLPRLAQRSDLWSLCRSITHGSNEHSAGHHIMLTGRSRLPPGFNASQPQATDAPSIAAIAGALARPVNNLPPAVVLPERLVHNSGRVIPGQFAGSMGSRRDPWFVEASPFHPRSYGAFPDFDFDHQERGAEDHRVFEAPNLALPRELTKSRFQKRIELFNALAKQKRRLEHAAATREFDRHRQGVISLLTGGQVERAIDVTRAAESLQDRYGKNSFGWSLLMAKQLIAAGVRLVQVNLGNNETWDTHGNAFPHLKNNLFPPTDQALTALLEDLHASGLLSETLIVVAGEFGRTPKISLLPQHYKLPGRDHWGAVQSVLIAGGGVQGGRIVGASDRLGAYPSDQPQKPENLAATIYHSLGLAKTVAWYDEFERPHHIYHGEPIPGLWA